MEIDITLIGTFIVLIIALAGLFASILQRLTRLESCVDPGDGDRVIRLETKVDLLLEWVSVLNGDITDNKKFLKKLKAVTQNKYKDKDNQTEF